MNKYCLEGNPDKANIFPTLKTDIRWLQLLMGSLHPISTGKELIRLGPRGDGGYLVPDDLAGIQACFSPGVFFESGFEKDCAASGMQVFMADKSVDGPAVNNELFHFTKKYVGATTNDDFMTLDDWVASAVPEKDTDLLLQIDIEGYEYEVFLSASNALMRRFRIIVAEFHALHMLWSWPFFKLAGHAFEKILQTHSCVHIHPNNYESHLQMNGLDIPLVMEFTFLRNDRIENRSYQKIFPHPLDYDNNPDGGSLVLPQCWYGGE